MQCFVDCMQVSTLFKDPTLGNNVKITTSKIDIGQQGLRKQVRTAHAINCSIRDVCLFKWWGPFCVAGPPSREVHGWIHGCVGWLDTWMCRIAGYMDG